MDVPTDATIPTEFHGAKPFDCTVAGNQLKVIPGGDARLAALLGLIDTAEHSLRMCFYIFEPDACGQRVRDALVASARRGVDVTLIIDSFGSSDTPASFFEPLLAAGGKFCSFSARASVRYLIRNHQKIVIRDEQVAMIGGFNVAEDYFAPPADNGWHDLALTIEGDAVAPLVTYFNALNAWTSNRKAQWRSIRRIIRTWQPGEGRLQWLLGGPTNRLSPWARCISNDLRQAKRLDIMSAYFSPARSLMRRIGVAARSGTARIVLPAKSDNAATIGASRLLYGYLLKRRAEIYEFSPCKLHTKLIVIDDAVYIGSANLDMRSLYLNLEIMLKVTDAAFADRMRAYIENHFVASERIAPAVHRGRATLLTRTRWLLSWFIVAVVDYTVTRRLNFGLR